MDVKCPDDWEIGAVRKQLGACTTQFDVFRFLRTVTEQFGFRYFVVAEQPKQKSAPFLETIVITSVPAGFLKRDEMAILAGSNARSENRWLVTAPTVRCFLNGAPICDDPACAQAGQLLVDFDIDCWYAVPVVRVDSRVATMSFLGKRSAPTFHETANLALLSAMVFKRLGEVSAIPKLTQMPLSDRERECLVWTAAGKTSVEIAKILDLSEHTVNHYLNNATHKIGTVNRTQAVAFALRNGWID